MERKRQFNGEQRGENGKTRICRWNRRLLSLSAGTSWKVFFDWRAQSFRGAVSLALVI
jgi:hypothetical protein